MEVVDYSKNVSDKYFFGELGFSNADFYPIKRYSQFEDKIARTINDPIAGITLPLAKLTAGDFAAVQIVVSPINSTNFRKRATKALRILNKGYYKNINFFLELFEKKFVQMGFWRRFFNSPALILLWILRFGSTGDSPKNIQDDDAEMSRGHERKPILLRLLTKSVE